MNYSEIGDLLKALRLSRSLSQEEACKDICDRRTYIRWEKNEVEPSNYNLHLLSNRFNYDLQAYYKFITRNDSLNTWKLKQQLDNYIQSREWNALFTETERLRNHLKFKSGENASLLCYYTALYYHCFKKEYENSANYCIQGLKIDNPAFSIDSPTLYFYSNIGLCLLNCLACNLNSLSKHEKANLLFNYILQSIDNKLLPEITYYQSTEFEIKIYQAVIYNLALNCQRNNDYKHALYYTQKGIDFLVQQNSLYELAELLKSKFISQYELKEYKEASLSYQQCMALYKLQRKHNEVTQTENKVHIDYPHISM